MYISLRDFSQCDLTALDAWTARGDLMSFMSRWMPRSFSNGSWSANLTCWQIIVADGKDVGAIWLERESESATTAELGIFVAEPTYRGLGVGRRAIELAEAVAIDRWNLEYVRLRVRESNRAAISCYRKVGFQVSGSGKKIANGQPIAFFEMTQRLNWPTQPPEQK